jgi:hypothetical protein
MEDIKEEKDMEKEINYMEMAVMNTAGEEQKVCASILKALEQKRKLRKIKVKVLKAVTWLAVVLFIVGALTFRAVTIPALLMYVSSSWLALMGFANSKLR